MVGGVFGADETRILTTEVVSETQQKKKYYKKFDKMSDGEMLEVIQVTDNGELFVIYIINDEEICRVKVYGLV